MKYKLLIFIGIVLISCQEKKSSLKLVISDKKNNEIMTDSISNTAKSNPLKFNLQDFKKIKGYKGVNLNSDESYDHYLLPISKQDYETENSKADIQNYKNKESKTFYVETDYGKVKFESTDADDMFLKYIYFGNSIVANYKIIKVYTIDSPLTIFLSCKKYDGFITNGDVYFSGDKEYFISVSNTPDYCLLEIYKVLGNDIVNIANLYSSKYQIDTICWGKELLFKTVMTNNLKYYFKIDWTRILQDIRNRS